jgi:pantoate--beta-alanine ligase
MMELAKTIGSVRALVKAARGNGRSIGFVPTMGALHLGHISLIEAAVEKCDFVVVSIFVNPIQFAPGEDFDKYPRPLDNDLKICEKAGADVVFAPSVNEMYPEKNITWINVEKLTEPLCGQSRPGHFRGVTTVCSKLFNIVTPDFAFFGQKDAQQAIVIKRMAADLNMLLEIVICPTVRQPDGLALSSRNQYLTDQQRKDAANIYKSLVNARQMIEQGVTNSQTIVEQIRTTIERIAAVKIEYISIVDGGTLQNVDCIAAGVLIAVAVRVGTTRLIDNILVDAVK